MSDKTVNLFDFSGGVVNSKVNPLNYPEKAVLDGLNCDLVNQWVRTRRGFEIVTEATFSGDVEYLTQAKFPTAETSYILAQVRSNSTCKLYVSDSEIPDEDITFTEIYNLGLSASTISCAQLNDRLVIADGYNSPLVFAGCRNADGSDWAMPKQIVGTVDDVIYWDASSYVCDTDSSTSIELPQFGTNLSLYICCDMKTIAGLYLGVATVNSKVATVTCYKWDGASWVELTVTDNTVTTGKTLAKSGTVTWTACDTEYRRIAGVPGYWIKVKWNMNPTFESAPRLSAIRFSAPCQKLRSIEDSGQTTLPMYFGKYISTTGTDYTLEVSSNSPDLYADVGGLSSSDAIWIGHTAPFCEADITIHTANTIAGYFYAYYWNGSAWVQVTISDWTNVGGKTLAASGKIYWNAPSAWVESRPPFAMNLLGYWLKLVPTTALSATCKIEEARLSIVPKSLPTYSYVVPYWDRVILVDRPDAHDQFDVSGSQCEYLWTGPSAISVRAGGLGRITAMIENYDQTWFSKAHDWFILDDSTYKNLELRRVEAANQTPLNNRVAIRGPADKSSRTYMDTSELLALDRESAYYINFNGAWCFTGKKIYSISQRVRWWERDYLPRLDFDYLHLATGVYWRDQNWLIWAVPMQLVDGTPQTTNNRLIIYDVEAGKWLTPFDLSVKSLAVMDLYTTNVAGNVGQQALYAGDYNGEVIRLFNPTATTDAGTDIEGWFESGWHHFGQPEAEKLLRSIYVYGSTESDTVTLSVYRDGNETVDTGNSFTVHIDEEANRLFAITFKHRNISARFFKLKFEFTGPTEIYGIQLALAVERNVPNTNT